MTDRSAFVTSAADGIGRATVPPLVEAGFAVVAVDIDRDGVDGTVDLVREAGGSCDVAIANVSDAEAVRFDGSFNDAGLLGAAGPITAYDEDFPDRVVAANQRGTILGLKYVLRDMVRQGSDLVVNTATVGAHGGAHRHHAPRRSTSPRPGQRAPARQHPDEERRRRDHRRRIRVSDPRAVAFVLRSRVCEPPRSPSASGSCSEMSPLTSPVPPFQSTAGLPPPSTATQLTATSNPSQPGLTDQMAQLTT
ncbi:SDR family NAD(P)-dependent oxidoreductase [Rhodococcus koreensis]|uniref:SDR family NAD(P)-dependent oxidoreductase n=1 Tax=Rhodococcus koreensis TaxID=99653 RepID=UPI0036DC9A1C